MTDKEALSKAIDYLKSMTTFPEEVREEVKEGTTRLETIQHFGSEWVVVLSYFPVVHPKSSGERPDWWEVVANPRRYREITMDENGHVLSLGDPKEAH